MSPLAKKRKKESGKPRKVMSNPLKGVVASTQIKKRTKSSLPAILLAIFLILLFIGIPLYMYTSIEKLKAISIEDSLDLKGRSIHSPEGLETFLMMIDTSDNENQATAHAYYLIWNTEKNSGLLIMLPGWIYVSPKSNAPENYVAVADLEYLVNEISEESPEALVEEYENIVGINVDDYLWIDAEARKALESSSGVMTDVDNSTEFLKSFNKKVNLSSLILSVDQFDRVALGIHTDISPVELYRRLNLINKLSGTESLPIIDLSEDWGSSDGSLSSGTLVSIMNYASFDEKLAEYFEIIRTREIEKEQVKIEVFNGGELTGLAGRIKRKLTNNGLKVVRAGNSPEDYEADTIYVSNLEEFDDSLEATIGILGYDDDVMVIEGRPDFLTTGDIIVIGVE